MGRNAYEYSSAWKWLEAQQNIISKQQPLPLELHRLTRADSQPYDTASLLSLDFALGPDQ